MSELKSTELHFKGPAQGFVLILSRSWSVHVLYYIFKALKNLNSFSLFSEEWAILVPLNRIVWIWNVKMWIWMTRNLAKLKGQMHSDILNHREIFIETNKNPRLWLVASLKFGLALVFIENTVFYLWSQLVFWVKKSVTSWYFSLSLIVQFCYCYILYM